MPDTINPPPDEHDKTGGPGAALVEGRLFDLAGSLHDSSRDLTLPVLPLRRWFELRFAPELIESLVATQAWLLTHVSRASDARKRRAAARQQAPSAEVDALEGLFKKGSEDPKAIAADIVGIAHEITDRLPSFRKGLPRPKGPGRQKRPHPLSEALDTSAAVARFINCRFLDSELPRGVDLRTGWYGIRDQRNSAGCVGWAVADALWRQRSQRLDIPSARFIWQAAKEIDGEKRPTTMIAGAGTSVRAGLNVVREYGFAFESELPSDSNAPYNGSIDTFYKVIHDRRIWAFINLGNDVKNRLAWLSLNRPIICTIMAGRKFADARGESLDGLDESESAESFAHAVLIAGYRFSRELEGSVSDAVRRFGANGVHTRRNTSPMHDELPIEYLVRNSVGRNWGDRGYAWVKHSEFYRSIMEEYGVFCSAKELEATQLTPDEYRRNLRDLLPDLETGNGHDVPPVPSRKRPQGRPAKGETPRPAANRRRKPNRRSSRF